MVPPTPALAILNSLSLSFIIRYWFAVDKPDIAVPPDSTEYWINSLFLKPWLSKEILSLIVDTPTGFTDNFRFAYPWPESKTLTGWK